MWSVWLSRNQQNNFKARIWIICQVKIREIVEWTGYGLLDKITWKKQINLALKNILCLWNVLSMNCPGNFFYEMFYLWTVLSMKCSIYELSYLWKVLSMKCPIYEMSYLWTVLSMKCSIYDNPGRV